MPFLERRRLIKIGKSNGVVLPKAWVDFYGDRVKNLVLRGNDMLIIAPETFAREARRLLERFHEE